MRVVYLWDADYPWDVRTEKVCRSLADGGAEVHIVARNRKGDAAREALPEGTVHRMPVLPGPARRLNGASGFPAFVNPRWSRHLARVVAEVRPHVIMVRDLPLCPVALREGDRSRIPVVLDMAETYPEMIRDIWRAGRQRWFDVAVRNPRAVAAVERHCLPRCDRVLTVVDESARRVEGLGVDPARVAVVSNTPPGSRLDDGEGREPWRGEGDLELAYVGIMEIPRGVSDLLEALPEARRRGAPVRLKLVGDGRDLELFRRRAGELGLGSDVAEFTGRLPHARAMEVLSRAHAGAVPHRPTPFTDTTVPNKLFDYMALGLPVLTADCRPCARIVEETGSGVAYRAAETADLVRALRALADPAALARWGRAGREAVRRHYRWETDLAVLVRTLEAVAAEGRTAPGSVRDAAVAAPAPAWSGAGEASPGG